MFVRMRWFAIGVLTSVGAMSYLAAQVKRAREKITARAMLDAPARALAVIEGPPRSYATTRLRREPGSVT